MTDSVCHLIMGCVYFLGIVAVIIVAILSRGRRK